MTDTLMRQYDPDEYDKSRAHIRRLQPGVPTVLRLHYSTSLDRLLYHYQTAAFYEQIGAYDLGHSVAWEAYDADGQLFDSYCSREFTEMMRAKAAEPPWASSVPKGVLAGNAKALGAPELWWQQERREAAVKQDALVALRSDVRHMLMGG